MRTERINDGSPSGVDAYFCECGNCNVWDTRKDIVERIEALHSEKAVILKEFQEKLAEFRKRECEILGIEYLNLDRFKIKR